MRKGWLFVISGPSAAGKTVVANKIFEADPTISKVVTCTTRSPRNNEKNGVDYYFLSKEEFVSLEKKGEFAESSEVYGNYYGVRVSLLKEKTRQGIDQILLINWEGFQKIKRKLSENVFGFFLTVPSLEELERRIRFRGTDSDEVIKNRLRMAEIDMQHKDEFDLCVENADIQNTVDIILRKINELRKK